MKAERKKKTVVGILAHVDAGKTTLSEAMLYLGGVIRRVGRVDHADAFLDNYALERERGITIFSKQAVIELPHTVMTLIDTPGHVDFSAETERTLQVLDYAILVISGTDGVQGHTVTLWKLLERYNVPTFLFINKMDLPGARRSEIMNTLRSQLSEGCVEFPLPGDEGREQAALCDEELFSLYSEGKAFSDANIASVANGAVTGVNAGTATDGVTTVDGNKTAYCTVIVKNPVIPKA
ncbi:MAG: GTP-binding protein, partial [Oscillospiraceae bacterium]|nr:GTP-binding protein [Oscillospiraceae bacterium]